MLPASLKEVVDSLIRIVNYIKQGHSILACSKTFAKIWMLITRFFSSVLLYVGYPKEIL